MKQELAKMICEYLDTADPYGYRDFCTNIEPEGPEDYVKTALDTPAYRAQIINDINEYADDFPEEAEAIRRTMSELYKEG